MRASRVGVVLLRRGARRGRRSSRRPRRDGPASRARCRRALAQQAILAAEDSRIDLARRPAHAGDRRAAREARGGRADAARADALDRLADAESAPSARSAATSGARSSPICLRFLPTAPRLDPRPPRRSLRRSRASRLPTDAGGQQVQAAFEALVQAGEVDLGGCRWRNRPIDRTAAVRDGRTRSRRPTPSCSPLMRKFDPHPSLRPALMPALTRGARVARTRSTASGAGLERRHHRLASADRHRDPRERTRPRRG